MLVDFALIGHQESWRAAADVLALLRGPTLPPIPEDEVPHILPWIPPRTVCRLQIRSILGMMADGLYIDSFIPPDRLDSAFLQENLARVRAAAVCAAQEGAKIVSLGGFSSILVEGQLDLLGQRKSTVFTTGNSLTVAFIVRGMETMCALQARDLPSATLLIVGATGDVGSGAARCLAPRVKRVLLHARNPKRLQQLACELRSAGARVDIAPDLQHPPARADLVLCAASLPSPSLFLDSVAPGAIICDAGYPKNLRPDAHNAIVFSGGLGQVAGGITSVPDVVGVLYPDRKGDVLHGCLLEGIALALERRFEPFSRGRGFITPARVQEIEKIAARHGICVAPPRPSDPNQRHIL